MLFLFCVSVCLDRVSVTSGFSEHYSHRQVENDRVFKGRKFPSLRINWQLRLIPLIIYCWTAPFPLTYHERITGIGCNFERRDDQHVQVRYVEHRSLADICFRVRVWGWGGEGGWGYESSSCYLLRIPVQILIRWLWLGTNNFSMQLIKSDYK